ncbi:MAG: crossover junction endodeoxyribonuclease RuvC [Oligoflexia bacterium]|nr:crossover junction endodeoxyribonuclease RuvC [Oligoflexia bacterium]
MRILGIDPGSNFLGLGCIETQGSKIECIGYRTLNVSAKVLRLEQKLRAIYLGVEKAIQDWKPQEVAVEDVFFAKNVKSALKLGQARGVALGVVSFYEIPIFEYAATEVKKTITGSGRAEKEQVFRMVSLFLGRAAVENLDKIDSSDALAIAICHGQSRKSRLLLSSAPQKRSFPRSVPKGKT